VPPILDLHIKAQGQIGPLLFTIEPTKIHNHVQEAQVLLIWPCNVRLMPMLHPITELYILSRTISKLLHSICQIFISEWDTYF